MKHCSSCGEKLGSKAKFCSSCGNSAGKGGEESPAYGITGVLLSFISIGIGGFIPLAGYVSAFSALAISIAGRNKKDGLSIFGYTLSIVGLIVSTIGLIYWINKSE